MKIAVAVFAKTVGMSQVKTRLALSIGRNRAEEFYRHSVAAIESVLLEACSKNQMLCPHWVLAEEAGPGNKQWKRFPAMWTGTGGLGERLANVSELLFEDHDGVMFIGTDSPQLSPGVFDRAVKILQEWPRGCVTGPASDGGFYLFGSLEPVSRRIWQGVNYSVDTTLSELTALVNADGIHVHNLPVEQDVDVVADLETLLIRLEASGNDLLPAQRMLRQWLQNC